MFTFLIFPSSESKYEESKSLRLAGSFSNAPSEKPSVKNKESQCQGKKAVLMGMGKAEEKNGNASKNLFFFFSVVLYQA